MITWLTFRRSGNEWARFLLRILDRCEQSLEFRTYPLYISTLNNIECGNLTRLSESTIPEYSSSENRIFAVPIHIFKFYSSDSFPRRIPMVPSDSERRLAYLHQISEKRTSRSIPRDLQLNPFVSTLGRGAGCWHNILQNNQDIPGLNLHWPSKTSFVTLPILENFPEGPP